MSPVSGTVVVPGSKSATARAYVLAALADGPSRLTGVLDARDTRLMRAALEALGVGFRDDPDGTVLVSPPAAFTPGAVEVGQAGTIMRFVPALAALADGTTTFTGDPEAEVRPVGPLLDGLVQAGATIDHGGAIPFTVHGTGAVPGGDVTIDASGSSQFVSGLLLAGARFERGLDLRHVGPPVPSRPHIRLTLAMLADRGVDAAETGPDTWHVAPGTIAARDDVIEPDLVNAAVFLAAAPAAGGSVTVPWPSHTVQASGAILATLEALGGVVTRTPGSVTVTGTGAVSGADLDLSEASELTCIAAALLALSRDGGRIRGVGHIRGHETDRLAALEAELGARGAEVRQTEDGLIVAPGALTGGTWRTHADHRMAHAGAVLGLAVPGVELDDVGASTKTMADFPGLWSGLVGA
ncbi:3-phosphoshikimate 1-carboxyvinyltransferase [Propioniciclava coleopterorum]|uniref:3-phosphoshikimate 1-carboxyvinyltransferase n=1 Tax=Propioniciclava coleopterorum TaxID=2714937 RepID=A0A6G7YBH6_9ACTN|nr:3-phosphoshikimate 1-carboxyvinyltransferase [Propioniciclava coleopterorum]QIK74001.1 3-phosphoshikimate 1-carboxyvinyltransferase [Propioniciclava coleopterorum]